MQRHAWLLVVSLALLAVPLAAAQSASTLEIQAPAQADASAPIPIGISLTLNDFACPNDTTILIALATSASGNANARFDADNVTLVIPSGSYMLEAWTGNATASLTIAFGQDSADDVTIQATYAGSPDGGDCIAPGGFPSAVASARLHVSLPSDGQTTTPTNETPAPTNETTTTPTNATSNGTAPPTTNSTSASNGTTDQLPPGGGYIGDYAPTESKNAPGPALAVSLAAVCVAAIAIGRRRR